jgi:uncharacterized protein
VVSEHLLLELTRTLPNKYFRAFLSDGQIEAALALVKRRAQTVSLTRTIQGVATHPEDDLILSTALSAEADFLVTGDKKLQRLRSYKALRIVSPAQLAAFLRAEEEKQAA